MNQMDYWNQAASYKEFTTPFQKRSLLSPLISEIHRVLKPGGILYINDFLLNTDERNLKRYEQFEPIFHNYGVFELPEGAVCRHHREEWIKELLHDFFEKEYEHLTFTTMNGHTSNGFYFLGQK